MASRSNKTGNPCEDFYNHACGTYIHTNNTPFYALNDIKDHEYQEFTTSYFAGSLNLDDPDKLYELTRTAYHKCINLGKYLYTFFC